MVFGGERNGLCRNDPRGKSMQFRKGLKGLDGVCNKGKSNHQNAGGERRAGKRRIENSARTVVNQSGP